MKRTRSFDFDVSPGRLIKSYNFRKALKCFFRPVTSIISRHEESMGTAVVGQLPGQAVPAFFSRPATVPFFAFPAESLNLHFRYSHSCHTERRSEGSLFTGRLHLAASLTFAHEYVTIRAGCSRPAFLCRKWPRLRWVQGPTEAPATPSSLMSLKRRDGSL